MQAVNVHALITGYDTVGDHTEFIVQVAALSGSLCMPEWPRLARYSRN